MSLEYASRSTARVRPWNVVARRACAATAVAATLLGLIVPEDLGSGAFILNPLRVVAVCLVFLCAALYAALRIYKEEHVPHWARALMTMCSSTCIALLPVAYHAWNRWRSHRWRYPFHDERFTRPLLLMVAAITAFAAVRVYLVSRRWSGNGGSSDSGSKGIRPA